MSENEQRLRAKLAQCEQRLADWKVKLTQWEAFGPEWTRVVGLIWSLEDSIRRLKAALDRDVPAPIFITP